MTDDTSGADTILASIKAKREEIDAYLKKTEPRHMRLVNGSIVCGALAAALTAGPGIGGSGFIEFAKTVVTFGVPVWQALCLAATVLSVVVVIANGKMKAHDLTTKITAARGCNSKLEGLQLMLETGQMDVERAASLYTQYITEVSHI
jgi:hypothetical protein